MTFLSCGTWLWLPSSKSCAASSVIKINNTLYSSLNQNHQNKSEKIHENNVQNPCFNQPSRTRVSSCVYSVFFVLLFIFKVFVVLYLVVVVDSAKVCEVNHKNRQGWGDSVGELDHLWSAPLDDSWRLLSTARSCATPVPPAEKERRVIWKVSSVEKQEAKSWIKNRKLSLNLEVRVPLPDGRAYFANSIYSCLRKKCKYTKLEKSGA